MIIKEAREKIDEVQDFVYGSECSTKEYYLFLDLLNQLRVLLNPITSTNPLREESNGDWVWTDENQWGRQLSFAKFEFKEDRKIDDNLTETHQAIIDLSDYTTEEVLSKISAYYNNVGEVFSLYGSQANWIIAECIFEQESGLY